MNHQNFVTCGNLDYFASYKSREFWEIVLGWFYHEFRYEDGIFSCVVLIITSKNGDVFDTIRLVLACSLVWSSLDQTISDTGVCTQLEFSL